MLSLVIKGSLKITMAINFAFHFLSSISELHQREYLDKCLSRALNIPLNDKKQLTAIDDENYVLTLDFTIKMLQIHERYECGEPVIIQGETGVGKTALVQMLSKLWNVSLDTELKQLKERLLEFLKEKLSNGMYDGLKGMPCAKVYPVCMVLDYLYANLVKSEI